MLENIIHSKEFIALCKDKKETQVYVSTAIRYINDTNNNDFLEFLSNYNVNEQYSKQVINHLRKKENLKQIHEKVYYNNIENGYYYHGTNSFYEKEINNSGLKTLYSRRGVKLLDEIKELNTIYQKHTNTSCFIMFDKQYMKSIFCSLKPDYIYYYSLNSPEWFTFFYKKINKYDEKKISEYHNFDKALNNIEQQCFDNNMTKIETQKFVTFFEDNYDLKQDPLLVLIKKDKNKLVLNDTENTYEKIKTILEANYQNEIVIKGSISKDKIKTLKLPNKI